MNTSLRTFTLIAIALSAFMTRCIHAQNTIIESALNDAYTLFEELITEGSKKTGLADRSFHQRFSSAKKTYLTRYKKELAPLLSDELFMPKFKLEGMILNIDQFTSSEKIARNNNLIAQIDREIKTDDVTRRKILGLTLSLGLFFAPYTPNRDLLLQGLSPDELALQQGLSLFALFKILNSFLQKDQKLGTDLFTTLSDDPYSPLYPMVQGFAKKTTTKTWENVLKKLTNTIEHGLCSLFNKVVKHETDPSHDWFYTFLKTDAEQWGAMNLAKEIEAKCGNCCELTCNNVNHREFANSKANQRHLNDE